MTTTGSAAASSTAQKAMRQIPIYIGANGVVKLSIRNTAAFCSEAERVWRNSKLPPIAANDHADNQGLTISCPAAARACSIGLNFAGPATAVYGFSLMFCGSGRRMLGSMSSTDPRANTPLVNCSDLRARELLTGTVTVLPADLEGSKRLLQTQAHEMAATGARPDRAVCDLIRLAALRVATVPFCRNDDALLTPTVGSCTPSVGRLDFSADYQQIIDGMLERTGFTPLLNAAGERAISLPPAAGSTSATN